MDDTKLKKNLGTKIKELRIKSGLTQEQLGECIGRGQRQISLIEIGESFPTPATLLNLSNIFCCPIKELFDFETFIDSNLMRQFIINTVQKMPDKKIKNLYNIIRNL